MSSVVNEKFGSRIKHVWIQNQKHISRIYKNISSFIKKEVKIYLTFKNAGNIDQRVTHEQITKDEYY